jgi:hypothetical protein
MKEVMNNMAITKNTEIVLEGVGSAMLIDPSSGTLTPLGTMQDMKISITTSTEKVYGGDSIFNFYEYIKDKSCSFEFTSAVLSLGMIQLSQGSTISVGECYGNDIVTVNSLAAQLSVAANVTTIMSEITVVNNATGVKLTPVSGTPANATEVKVSALGVLTFYTGTVDGTKYNVSYVYRPVTGTTGTDILTTTVPGFVELRHVSKNITMPVSDQNPTGGTYRVHTRIYRARCDGSLDINYARGTASAPKAKFSSLDPQRADKKFMSVTFEQIA